VTGGTIPRRGTAMGATLAGQLGATGYVGDSRHARARLTAVAAPVRDYHDEIVAALSIIGPPTARQSRHRAIRAAARRFTPDALSSALGASGGPRG